MKYRAIYEFDARNQDEISFQPGDIVMVRRALVEIICDAKQSFVILGSLRAERRGWLVSWINQRTHRLVP